MENCGTTYPKSKNNYSLFSSIFQVERPVSRNGHLKLKFLCNQISHCIYSFCSIELTKTRNTWSLTAVKTTCADQRPNKKMATRDAVGSGIVPAFVSADPSSSQTDKCLGRPITKRWGSAARHSSSEPHLHRRPTSKTLPRWETKSFCRSENFKRTVGPNVR